MPALQVVLKDCLAELEALVAGRDPPADGKPFYVESWDEGWATLDLINQRVIAHASCPIVTDVAGNTTVRADVTRSYNNTLCALASDDDEPPPPPKAQKKTGSGQCPTLKGKAKAREVTMSLWDEDEDDKLAPMPGPRAPLPPQPQPQPQGAPAAITPPAARPPQNAAPGALRPPPPPPATKKPPLPPPLTQNPAPPAAALQRRPPPPPPPTQKPPPPPPRTQTAPRSAQTLTGAPRATTTPYAPPPLPRVTPAAAQTDSFDRLDGIAQEYREWQHQQEEELAQGRREMQELERKRKVMESAKWGDDPDALEEEEGEGEEEGRPLKRRKVEPNKRPIKPLPVRAQAQAQEEPRVGPSWVQATPGPSRAVSRSSRPTTSPVPPHLDLANVLLPKRRNA
ncbi:hypothetical protein V5O48_014345 [Marasmius crinis-equi]|uniref:Uncharacterized protein n=1 Tax=Marasmius crinis-equi TaxID=585013 RepID=A0ABR3EXJ6_9AGAR